MISFYQIKKDVYSKWKINVDLTFTTKVDGTVYGYAMSDNNIVINANKFTSEKKILAVIAHELAHVLSDVDSSNHGHVFDKTLYEIIGFMNDKYNIDITPELDFISMK